MGSQHTKVQRETMGRPPLGVALPEFSSQSIDLRAKEQEMPRQRDPGGWSCSFLSRDLVWGPGLYIWWKVFCWAPYLVCGNKARILMKTVAAVHVLVPVLCFAGHFLRLAIGCVHPSP